jgi:hypothetical protein
MKNLIIAIGLMLFSVAAANAQIVPPNQGQNNNPQAAPIDGGAVLLLAASGIYGMKRMRKRSMNKEEAVA